METLRAALRETDPGLLHALETSWKVAESEWIPTLNMQDESYAGLPHLESVEAWMDRLALAWKPVWSRHSQVPFGFNGVELYLALCAALFHDIGRGRGKEHHGQLSADIVSQHWAQLGIVNVRVAEQLAHVCAFHTTNRAWNRPDAVRIHPWGTVHTQAIAALLVLADELDTAYTRRAPLYMKDPSLEFRDPITLDKVKRLQEHHFTKGLYRNYISDVELDPASNLIKTVLVSDGLIGGPRRDESPRRSPDLDEWLDGTAKLMETSARSLPPFDAADYFFSFLDHLRATDDSGLLHVLVEQFGNAYDFARSRLIRAVRPLARNSARCSPLDLALVYDLNLWDRQPIHTSDILASEDDAELAHLDNTIALIRDTFEGVEKKIHEQRAGGESRRCFEQTRLEWVGALMHAVLHGDYYLAEKRRLVAEEKRRGVEPTTIDLEALRLVCGPRFQGPRHDTRDARSAVSDGGRGPADTDASEAGTSKTREEELTRARGEAAGRLENARTAGGSWFKTVDDLLSSCRAGCDPGTAHALLVVLFRCLARIDLRGLVVEPEGLRWTEDESIAREWSSWSLEAFHLNLLRAFHIYLVIVRRLWCGERELDYRYAAAGGFEQAFRAAPGDSEEEARQSQLVWFSTLLAPGSDVPSVACRPLPQDKRPATPIIANYMQELRSHAQDCKPRLGRHTMSSEAFDLAVRLIFMQWLSNDIRTKNDALGRIRDGLAKLEIKFDEWMIEYNNHLFDASWYLRLEPNLEQEDLLLVADKMFHLRSGLHRRDEFLPWETLAASVRYLDIDRVKTAASRFGNLLRIYGQLRGSLDDRRIAGEDEVGPTEHVELHFGHMLLGTLLERKRRAVRTSTATESRWLLETSHSDWRLTPPERTPVSNADSPAEEPWMGDLEVLKRVYLKRIRSMPERGGV